MSSIFKLRSLVFSAVACTAVLGHVPGTAHADGMRCGSRLVSDGDSMFEVTERCGQPDAATQHVELRTVRSYVEGPCFKENGVLRCGTVIEQTVQVIVDDWTYDFGPDSLVRHLTFEQGKLLRLKTGGYGSKQT
ncbi:MAG: hypothetical protein JWN04_2280 [Myxococcaceae bacterium]|nr:hypothetical protein [Myxococcaceae bacterium]